ncbi:hypothetical protein [Fluviicola taffensis]|nr:hypothetical protein [Fluviicola taffensis]
MSFHGPHWRNSIINSDGRGYYYFLPAVSTSDNTFEKTLQSEQKIVGKDAPQLYILKTEEGLAVNKCYPGVAILQSPFYATATLVDWIGGKNFDGYSDNHLIFFFFGSLLYVFLSILFFQKVLAIYFESSKYTWLVSIALIFATNVWYHGFFYGGLSHHYSLFLFSLFCWNILRYKRDYKMKFLIYLGIILGLLFLVRPTNMMILAILPFLFKTRDSFLGALKKILQVRNGQLAGFISAFLTILMLLPLITYWQTGHFFYWSYQGEGFDFSGKHLLETWISYRIGIFVHAPIALLSIIGLVYWLRTNRYLFVSWILPFITITYVLSSWWCWDYQSFFGHRGFIEFQFLFTFPLIVTLQIIRNSVVKYGLLTLVFGYMGIRSYQCVSGVYPKQRFTAYTYWKSILDFNYKIPNKYSILYNCQPFGTVVSTKELVPTELKNQKYDGSIEFGQGLTYHLKDRRRNIRYFFEFHLTKQLLEDSDWKDIEIIFAAQNKKEEQVYYYAFPLYSFYKEGKEKAIDFEIQEEVYPYANSSEKIGFYIWNRAKKQFKINDFSVVVKKIAIK